MLILQLDAEHEAALAELAAAQDMSPEAVMRQALRVYQMVYSKALVGQRLAFVDKDGGLVMSKSQGLGFV